MCAVFSYAVLNPYIYVIFRHTDGNKSLIMHDQHTLLGFYYIKIFFLKFIRHIYHYHYHYHYQTLFHHQSYYLNYH